MICTGFWITADHGIACGNPLTELRSGGRQVGRLRRPERAGGPTHADVHARLERRFPLRAAVAADLDHDGWLDLVRTNGWEGHNARDDAEWQSETTRVFRNLTAVSPALTFADVAEQAGLVHREQGRGLVHLDYDNDGDQDLVIFNNGGLPTLVRNELNPGSGGSGGSDGSERWLRVFLCVFRRTFPVIPVERYHCRRVRRHLDAGWKW